MAQVDTINSFINKHYTMFNDKKIIECRRQDGLLITMIIEEVFQNKIYERYFKVEDGDTVVDIGSHVGVFPLSLDGDFGKIYCVEPDEGNFKDLNVNLSRYFSKDKFEAYNYAIGKETGYDYLDPVGDMGFARAIKTRDSVKCPTSSFLDFIKQANLSKIDFLKLDCEGGEYAIISDENREFIQNNVKKIVGELHLEKPEYNAAALSFVETLEDWGFDVILNSLDGFDITNSFKNKLDYYTEIIFYAVMPDNKLETPTKHFISFDSKSLGDNLAWMPYVEEFRKKNNCKVVLSTFWNDLFEKEYPEIEFIGRGEVVHNIHGQHNIGWYTPWDPNKNPNDFRTIPLQQTASDILGLDHKEVKPKITIPDKPRTIEEKYVCIGMHSTCQSKYWNYPDGWQKITDYLNEKGYKVVHISKEQGEYMGNKPPENIVDKTGDFSIGDRIVDLKHAEMFIGIGSGLSWLSWAVGTPTVLISGFSAPFCEPQEGIERVFNPNVCNSCFNDSSIQFDPGDWNWCPRNKEFECSKEITPKMVIEKIDKIIDSKIHG